MDFGIATHHAHAYTVNTPVYEGPLDLLLQLIERAELDITRLALSQVTDQYLAHLHNLQDRAVEEVSAFLVIAAKLLQIKSEVLLPRPPVREEGEEDPGEALARQLLAYKRYKEIANLLSAREAAGMRSFLRLAPPPKVEGMVDLTGLNIADLFSAALSAFAQADTRHPLGSVVTAPRVTIREKIILITRFLRQNGRATFQHLFFSKPTHLDIVVTFLAMLELVKRHLILAEQGQLFGEIEIQPSGLLEEDETFELEFGE